MKFEMVIFCYSFQIYCLVFFSSYHSSSLQSLGTILYSVLTMHNGLVSKYLQKGSLLGKVNNVGFNMSILHYYNITIIFVIVLNFTRESSFKLSPIDFFVSFYITPIFSSFSIYQNTGHLQHGLICFPTTDLELAISGLQLAMVFRDHRIYGGKKS